MKKCLEDPEDEFGKEKSLNVQVMSCGDKKKEWKALPNDPTLNLLSTLLESKTIRISDSRIDFASFSYPNYYYDTKTFSIPDEHLSVAA